MNYTNWKDMNKGVDKQASLDKQALNPLLDSFGAVGDATNFGLALLVAGLASTGGISGWLGAKLNAHDKQDIGTIQKEYENERLKADLGYLTAKIKSEYSAQQSKQPPKAARVFA